MVEPIEPIEFDCEGCGSHVFSFGADGVPKHHLCATCAWLCEEVPDPEQMMQLRQWLDRQ